MARKDLLTFLFGESVELEAAEADNRELDIAKNLERLFEAAAEAEVGELKSKKTPLAKALSELGISDAADDLELDTDGFVLATDNHERYVDAMTVLGSADAMHKLAEMGWVVNRPGDNAMTNEPPNYRIRFLEIATAEENNRELKAGTYDTANREEVVKKAQKFASTPMDRDNDSLNPVENDIFGSDDNQKGVGKEKEGADPEGKPKGSEGRAKTADVAESEEVKLECPKCGTEHTKVNQPDKDPEAPFSCYQCGYEGKPKRVAKKTTESIQEFLGEVYFGGGTWEKGHEQHCPKCKAVAVATGTSNGQVRLSCPKCGHKWQVKSGDKKEESLQEFTSTGSMGTALSQGQPFVGMVKKPKPYGKGTKFKMPGQWKVKQPVVDQQVKRKVRSESEEDEGGFDTWFENNKNSESLRDDYQNAVQDLKATGEKISFKGWCRKRYNKRDESAENSAESFLQEEGPGDIPGEEPEPEADDSEAESRQAYEDMRSELESGECAVLDDSKASGPTRVIFLGKELGVISDSQYAARQRDFQKAPEGVFMNTDQALRALESAMEAAQFWPNIYHINDHGNVSLLDNKGNIIHAWV